MHILTQKNLLFNKITKILFVLFLLNCLNVFSQNTIKFEHLTTENGLSQSDVNTIFQDKDGFYYWAKNDDGYSDNSLITATMSIYISIMAKEFLAPDLKTNLWDRKFDRDGVDRSRFSMDFYYPYLAGIKNNKSEFLKSLEDFYVKGLGVKCVKEEPWVTVAESCECVIAALAHENIQIAEDIFNDIQQFQDSEGIFPTGYQYDLKIFWPEEKSTWTNAAVIIAAHALSSKINTNSVKKNVFLELCNFFKSN